jgi:hypothetical protein
MSELWPWLALVGLGAWHGLNPAMGWLFAVALGLHRGSTSVVMVTLLPIAFGHALSIVVIVAAALAAGLVLDGAILRQVAGVLLIGWALYHAVYGRRHRVRFGMQVGIAGLVAWSFLMASAHGAGLMLVPALMPLCLSDGPLRAIDPDAAVPVALAATGIHVAATLAVTGVIAVVVYRWIGLEILRSAWINFDALWTVALVASGALLLLV